MRILVAHNRYKYAGGEDAVAANEIAMLRSHGHEVSTLEVSNAIITNPLSTIRAAGALFHSETSYRLMSDAISSFRPQVVHIHNWFPLLSPSVISAANRAGVPVVQTLHNFRMLCVSGILYRNGSVCQSCVAKALPAAGILHACYRDSHAASAVATAAFAYHRAKNTWNGISRFIALSEFQKELLVRGGLPEPRITIKPNVVFDSGNARDGDRDYFLFVGRLTPEKGVRTALRAWEQNTLPLPLRIIGDGPLRAEVTERAANTHNIQYLGPVTHAEVAAQMASAKALIFPSEWYEPFPLTIIEAFSHGTPVIAADLQSIRHLVQHTRTGLTFPAASGKELAEQVRSMSDDAPGHRSMRARCRAEYETRYTPDLNYQHLVDIYNRVIEERAQVSSVGITPSTSQPTPTESAPPESPALANVLGIPVHAVSMEAALASIHSALQHGRKGYVCLAGAHGIMEAHHDLELRRIAAGALLVLPDGMPTVWIGRSQGHNTMDRVFGPDLMLEVLGQDRFRGTTHFFWGGNPGVAEHLCSEMQRRFPHAHIVGTGSPPFDNLTNDEQNSFIAKIARLKPDIIWVGVSTPRQDRLMADLSPLLDTTLMIGVGAAFLFHTGAIQDSPNWIKRAGFQWLHRLGQEPSRLWRRYLACVPLFAFHALLQASGLHSYPLPSSAIAQQPTSSTQLISR